MTKPTPGGWTPCPPGELGRLSAWLRFRRRVRTATWLALTLVATAGLVGVAREQGAPLVQLGVDFRFRHEPARHVERDDAHGQLDFEYLAASRRHTDSRKSRQILTSPRRSGKREAGPAVTPGRPPRSAPFWHVAGADPGPWAAGRARAPSFHPAGSN